MITKRRKGGISCPFVFYGVNMKEFQGWRKRPAYSHAPCETKGCINYYNTTYKDADGYCKSCKKRRKDEQELRSNPKS